jgi:hypothetical protein
MASVKHFERKDVFLTWYRSYLKDALSSPAQTEAAHNLISKEPIEFLEQMLSGVGVKTDASKLAATRYFKIHAQSILQRLETAMRAAKKSDRHFMNFDPRPSVYDDFLTRLAQSLAGQAIVVVAGEEQSAQTRDIADCIDASIDYLDKEHYFQNAMETWDECVFENRNPSEPIPDGPFGPPPPSIPLLMCTEFALESWRREMDRNAAYNEMIRVC